MTTPTPLILIGTPCISLFKRTSTFYLDIFIDIFLLNLLNTSLIKNEAVKHKASPKTQNVQPSQEAFVNRIARTLPVM